MKLFMASVLCAVLAAAESKLKLENLPPAVRKTVEDETRNAVLKGVSKEKEGGKTLYEVETKVGGKSRDLMVSESGSVVSVEQETALESIPPAARDAIVKKVGPGKIKMVETMTQGALVSYEVSYTGKGGKGYEYAVNADGSAHK